MSSSTATKRKRILRTLLVSLSAISALVLLTLLAAFLTMQTAWFKNKVRERVMAAIQDVTGGQVQLGAFSYDWRTLTADFRDLVVRGTEPAGQAPLFRAQSIRLRLKIVSAFKRDFDISALTVDRPEVHLLVSAHGQLNLPSPDLRALSANQAVADLLKLKVGRFEFNRGSLDVNANSVPLNMRGEDVFLSLAYDRRQHSYNIKAASPRLRVDAQEWPSKDIALDAEARLDKDRLLINRSRLISENSELDASGALQHFAHPTADLQLSGHVDAEGFAKYSGLTAIRSGDFTFNGAAHYDSSTPLRFSGTIAGHDVAYRYGGTAVNRLEFQSELSADSNGAEFNRVTLSALGARLTGKAVIAHLRDLQFDGELSHLGTRQATDLLGLKPLPWLGTANGPVHLALSLANRAKNLTIQSKLQITPNESAEAGMLPVAGAIDVTYRRATQLLEFGDSQLSLPATQLSFSGIAGTNIHVALESSNLDDLKPALAALGTDLRTISFPGLLGNGRAHFDGTIIGPLPNPQIQGSVALDHFEFRGQPWDQFHAQFTANANGVDFVEAGLAQASMSINGAGRLGFHNWTADTTSPIHVQAEFKRVDLVKLTAVLHGPALTPITGSASGSLSLSGSLANPQGNAQLSIDNLDAYGETLSHTQLFATIADDQIEITKGRVQSGGAMLTFSGGYRRAASWINGELRLKVDSNGFPLATLGIAHKFSPGLDAEVQIHGEAAIEIAPDHIEPKIAQGTAIFRDVTVQKAHYGSVTIAASTHGQLIAASISGDLRKSRLAGTAQVQLLPGNPLQGQIHLDRIALSTLLAIADSDRKDGLPLEGSLSADASFSGLLQRPDQLHATVAIKQLDLTSRLPVEGTNQVQTQNLIFHNPNPIVLEAANGIATIRAFQIEGQDTQLDVSGTVPYLLSKPMNVAVHGSADLRLFQLLDPNVQSSGSSVISASLQGTLAKPQVNGALELKNGTFLFKNAPNVLTAVNGTVTFDRDRATIQKLTAQTGGGALSVGGFVNFARPGSLVYRLEGHADNVRVRYAGGVSVTGNSELQLTGTSDNSVLSGTATISRIVFNPNTDVGNLLALAAAPSESPTNEKDFLTGMQFDVRVESAPDLQLTTELSRDVQAEIDLRLRGTPAHPILLGNISANQGEIRVFGSKYSINRGEVSFVNSAKIDPVLDLDLQTQARGITVDVTVSGTLGKLNINYRSDPPLQPRDIIALLTVGRTPSVSSNLPSAQVVNDVSALQSGGNTVLGQAIAPPSNRLSKLFGITNIRIDPMVQGITNTPQARLTIEQNISRQVTVTYVTNLSETSEQIFRLEWAFSPQYSLVALRDDNGEFGLDIQYRKRFK